MIRRTYPAKLLCALSVLLFARPLSLPAQTHAEKERINAAETAAARERAQKANPTGRFDAQFDAISKVKQSDIDAAFTTKSDMDFFLKQEAWRKENQRRIDFENSPAGRAKAEAAIAAEKLRKKNEQAARDEQAAAAEAATARRFTDLSARLLQTAHDLVRRALADEVATMSYRDITDLVSVAEALLTDGEFSIRPAQSLGFGAADRREALALELYARIGWISGGEGGRYDENRWVRRPVMDLVMPAALLKGGHGDVLVRHVRAIDAMAGADARTQMQITVGLASALAMPKGDLSPSQRNLAAALLADRARDIPPGSREPNEPDGRAFSWMLLAAAERMPELARAPSLKPHFDFQSHVRPRSALRSSTPAPKPGEFATTVKATAQGNWWNLASMLVLAENSHFPHPWFAAMRNERRAKRQPPAPAESRAMIQRALDDWFSRNGTTVDARKFIQSDCDLACEAGVEKLADSAAWDEYITSAVFKGTAAYSGDRGLADLLSSTRLHDAIAASGGDTTGAQRWLVDPRWQPDAKAPLDTWRAWLELAGPAGIVTVVTRAPAHLADPWFFRRGVEALQLADDGQLKPASVAIAHALLSHAAEITAPDVVRAFALVRGRCLGDWVGLGEWLDDPRRQPKESDAWFGLYQQANRERDQVAGKLKEFKLGSDEDFALCAKFEAWLKEVLKSKGAVRAALLAECPGDMLAKPDLRLLGYDGERGGFASRAMLLLTAPKFDPRLPVKNGGRYDSEPWLAAVAKLPATVDAEELVEEIATNVSRAFSDRLYPDKTLESKLSLEAGIACQRALGRLASRWSPARVPAQEVILRFIPFFFVGEGMKPQMNAIAGRIDWERALMKGLNAADAFAQVSPTLKSADLSFIVGVGRSPTSPPPLVLADDEYFFREARRALAAK